MATNAEIREFLEEICEVPVTVKDDLSVFKHAHDSTEPCELICTETFYGMPNKIVETLVIEADPLKSASSEAWYCTASDQISQVEKVG